MIMNQIHAPANYNYNNAETDVNKYTQQPGHQIRNWEPTVFLTAKGDLPWIVTVVIQSRIKWQ